MKSRVHALLSAAVGIWDKLAAYLTTEEVCFPQIHSIESVLSAFFSIDLHYILFFLKNIFFLQR